jgi:phage terminase large subunit-like protein
MSASELLEFEAIEEERERREADREAVESFQAFVRRFWSVVEPRPLEWGPHMAAVCDALQSVAEGRCKRLIINIPPGFSKSLLTSVFLPAWKWLRWPSDRTLYLSHDAALARRDSRRTRNLIQSPEYRALLDKQPAPWTMTRDQNEVLNFENSAMGFRYCASLGSGITGKRGDNIVIDDPHDVKEAIQGAEDRIAERLAAEGQNFDQVINSRLNDQRTGSIVIIMQRVHEGDLTGHCIASGDGWETLILPMRYDPEIADPKDWRTVPGELLDPVRFPESIVAAGEIRLGSQASGQYGQRPVAAKGGMFPANTWVYVDRRHFPTAYTRQIAGSDLAFGGTNAGDFHVIVHAGLYSGRAWLYDGLHLRCEADVLIEAMVELRRRFPKATGWYMEAAAAAKPTAAIVRSRIPGIVLVPPVGDKVGRAQAWQPYAAAGNIVLPCTCGKSEPHPHDVPAAALPAEEWVRSLVAEHAVFPKGRHDDWVDGTGYAVVEILKRDERDWSVY